MSIASIILSKITIFNKYSKYLPSLKRRETWDEICNRYEDMMTEKYPKLTPKIVENMKLVREKKILPSMRAMQFAGSAVKKNNSRLYNCAYLPIDSHKAFAEVMFLLLGGTGVGYSVQTKHVDKLPKIRKPEKWRKYLIGDSLEGWADAVKVIMEAYFGKTDGIGPRFDFSDIRAKGQRLITAGGKAPGPEPLRICLTHIQSILETKAEGSKLKPIEVHDILCHIANAVLSGGIRRSAMIALFSFDDNEMLTCKYGNWWEGNEQRGRANNSVVILRSRIKKKEFQTLWKKIELSNSGEPGMYFTNDVEMGTNPCCEIALKPFQFCNL
jgi:ribonucleoside-triphosphate reductase (thioredoxin)